jgi:hypothetical protein
MKSTSVYLAHLESSRYWSIIRSMALKKDKSDTYYPLILLSTETGPAKCELLVEYGTQTCQIGMKFQNLFDVTSVLSPRLPPGHISIIVGIILCQFLFSYLNLPWEMVKVLLTINGKVPSRTGSGKELKRINQ